MVRQSGQILTLEIDCRDGARQVYVIGDFDGGGRVAVPMRQTESARWSAEVALPPGTYRYRYYVDDGERTTYYGPAGSDVSEQDAWDWTVEVPDAAAASQSGDRGVACR